MVRVGIIGAEGRMGQRIIARLQQQDDLQLVAALTEKKSQNIGKDAGFSLNIETGVPLSSDLASIAGEIPRVDVMIDFSTPEATIENLPLLWEFEIPIVIGTRDFDEAQMDVVFTASHLIPVQLSRNASLGINLIYAFLYKTASLFGNEIEYEIIESTKKSDKPVSTVSTKMSQSILRGKKHVASDEDVVHYLEREKPFEKIKYKQQLEAENTLETHIVKLKFQSEEIEVIHRIESYNLYADGALWCARWLSKQRPGFYEITDMIENHNTNCTETRVI